MLAEALGLEPDAVVTREALEHGRENGWIELRFFREDVLELGVSRGLARHDRAVFPDLGGEIVGPDDLALRDDFVFVISDDRAQNRKDGTFREAELMVLATGYETQGYLVKELFGEAVRDRAGQVWGFNDNQEMANMWTRTGQPGLWFTAGAFSQCRIYGKFLAQQIAMDLRGLSIG